MMQRDYRLRFYNNDTALGMSEEPVLDSQGQLIGIHGRAAGNRESGKMGINLGIPNAGRKQLRQLQSASVKPQTRDKIGRINRQQRS